MVDVTDGPSWEAGYELGRHVGFRLGVDWARRAYGNAIAQACQGIPYTAGRVVGRLVKSWGVPAARAPITARPDDWPGVERMTASARAAAYRKILESWSS